MKGVEAAVILGIVGGKADRELEVYRVFLKKTGKRHGSFLKRDTVSVN